MLFSHNLLRMRLHFFQICVNDAAVIIFHKVRIRISHTAAHWRVLEPTGPSCSHPQKNWENVGAISAYSKFNGAITRVRVKLVAEWETRGGGRGGWMVGGGEKRSWRGAVRCNLKSFVEDVDVLNGLWVLSFHRQTNGRDSRRSRHRPDDENSRSCISKRTLTDDIGSNGSASGRCGYQARHWLPSAANQTTSL
jgi:hypothetical protein